MTKMKGCFYGIPSIRFIWHGPYSDPEVMYRGVRFNYWDLEEAIWDIYEEERAEKGVSIDSLCPSTDGAFEDWVFANYDTVYGYLNDWMVSMWDEYTDDIDDKKLQQIEALYAAILEDYHAL